MVNSCKVFISYSHKDEALRDSKVEVGVGYPRAFLSRLHAAVLARDDLLTKDQIFFDDDRLNVSPEWRKTVNEALEQCGLLIFLVSPHSLLSEFCMTTEMARAFQRNIHVITVLLCPSPDWYKVEIRNPESGVTKSLGEWHSGGLPKVSGNTKAVSEWDREDAAWANVTERILRFIEEHALAQAPAASSNPTPEPWPEWSPDEAPYLDGYRQRLVACFAEPVFRSRLGFIFDHPEHRLPGMLGRALQVAPDKAGEAASLALLKLLADLSRRLKVRTLAMTREDCAAVSDQFKAALGAAARMCLDPKVMREKGLDGLENAALCWRLPATEVAGATLAVRAEPHNSWKRPENRGGAALEDKLAIPVTIELADTLSAGKALAKALHVSLYSPDASPTEMDEQTIARLHGEAEVNASLGEARYFVLSTEPDHHARLTPELESWVVEKLATGVLVREPATGAPPLFRYRETTLLALIGRAYEMLDAPEWTP